MTQNINPAAILTDLAALMTDLAEHSRTKHGKANAEGQQTLAGAKAEGQSHAYGNAALRLQEILDKYTS